MLVRPSSAMVASSLDPAAAPAPARTVLADRLLDNESSMSDSSLESENPARMTLAFTALPALLSSSSESCSKPPRLEENRSNEASALACSLRMLRLIPWTSSFAMMCSAFIDALSRNSSTRFLLASVSIAWPNDSTSLFGINVVCPCGMLLASDNCTLVRSSSSAMRLRNTSSTRTRKNSGHWAVSTARGGLGESSISARAFCQPPPMEIQRSMTPRCTSSTSRNTPPFR